MPIKIVPTETAEKLIVVALTEIVPVAVTPAEAGATLNPAGQK